nr:MAG TPA: hypothetical protein [Bacteriophage sp.]
MGCLPDSSWSANSVIPTAATISYLPLFSSLYAVNYSSISSNHIVWQ